MKWSIMIPVFNNLEHLAETLLSVLNQKEFDFKTAQIEVIDNCSTDGDVKELVDRVGNGLIRYYCHPTNIGLVNNWNSCIERAQGEIIHILHGDDYVEDTFYHEYSQMFNNTNAKAIFCSNFYLKDTDLSMHPILQHDSGALADKSQIFTFGNIQCPSVCIKKEVYNNVGFFDSNYTECVDWHMWKTIATKYDWYYIPKALCTYRIHGESYWNQRKKNGVNFKTLLKSIEYFKEYNYDYYLAAKENQIPNIKETINYLTKEKDLRNLYKNFLVYYLYTNAYYKTLKTIKSSMFFILNPFTKG